MEESGSLNSALTDKEFTMLAAVVLQMGDFPKVDFQKVGDLVGIKHGRNARTKFNTIWDKLKQACPEAVKSVGSAGDAETAGNDAEMDEVKPKTPTKASVTKKKGTPHSVPRNRKATAGIVKTPRKARGKAVKSEEVAAEEVGGDEGEGQGSEVVKDEEVMNDSEAERREAARMNKSVSSLRAFKAIFELYDPTRRTTPEYYLSGGQ